MRCFFAQSRKCKHIDFLPMINFWPLTLQRKTNDSPPHIKKKERQILNSSGTVQFIPKTSLYNFMYLIFMNVSINELAHTTLTLNTFAQIVNRSIAWYGWRRRKRKDSEKNYSMKRITSFSFKICYQRGIHWNGNGLSRTLALFLWLLNTQWEKIAWCKKNEIK